MVLWLGWFGGTPLLKTSILRSVVRCAAQIATITLGHRRGAERRWLGGGAAPKALYQWGCGKNGVMDPQMTCYFGIWNWDHETIFPEVHHFETYWYILILKQPILNTEAGWIWICDWRQQRFWEHFDILFILLKSVFDRLPMSKELGHPGVVSHRYGNPESLNALTRNQIGQACYGGWPDIIIE
jgi:hypothetical protein